MRRYRLVLAGALIGLLVGVAFGIVRTPDYESEAQVIVQDPRASSLSDALGVDAPSTQASERFVADQVEIMRSRLLVEQVRDELGYDSLEQVYDRVTITGDLTSNLIEVVFVEGSPEEAQEGAAAFVAAYQDVVATQKRATAESALAQADALLAGLDETIADFQEQISEAEQQDTAREELRRVEADLAAVREARDAAALGSDQRAALNLRIDELIRDLGALQQIVAAPDPSSRTGSLIQQRDDAVAARSDLLSRRNAIAVNADATSDRIVLDSPASFPEEPVGPPWWLLVAAFAIFGAAAAALAAYSLEMRHRRLMTSADIRSWVDIQMLGDIPRLPPGGALGAWLISEEPYSTEAEAFRLTAETIGISARRVGAQVLAFVSSTVGAGKTTVVSNLALASAEQGNRVLVVDADFATHDLTRLLLSNGLLVEDVRFEPGHTHGRNAVMDLWGEDGGALSFVSLDAPPDKVVSFLRSDAVAELLAWARQRFDIVLVDGPPPLSIAYASSLVQVADLAVLVIEHGNTVESIEELANRLEFLDRPALGYVYTKSSHGGVVDFEGSLAALAPRDD